MPHFLIIDGHFQTSNTLHLSIHQSDKILLQERIRSIRNQLPFWENHMQRLKLQLQLHHQSLPPILQNNGKYLKRQIERLLVKNKYYKSAVIHLYLLEDQHSLSYMIDAHPIAATSYLLNGQGLKIAGYSKLTKGVSALSTLELGSTPYWKVIDSDPEKQTNDEFLLLNDQQSFLEAPRKNLYAITKNTIACPSPVSGAFIDVSQDTIQKISLQIGLKFRFVEKLSEVDLLKADEIFLANSIDGIEWVKAFKSKRYFNKTTQKINEVFNRDLLV